MIIIDNTTHKDKILIAMDWSLLHKEAPKTFENEGETYYRGEIDLVPEKLSKQFAITRWYYKNKNDGIDHQSK